MIRCLLLLALALWFAVVVLLLAGYAKAQGVSQGNARTDTRVRVGTIPNEGETVDGIFLVPTPGTVNPVGYIPTAPGAGRSSNLKPQNLCRLVSYQEILMFRVSRDDSL